MLREIRTYWGAIDHARLSSGGKGDIAILVRDLAHAKGLPARARESQIETFFGG
jgi:hypothetical protein